MAVLEANQENLVVVDNRPLATRRDVPSFLPPFLPLVPFAVPFSSANGQSSKGLSFYLCPFLPLERSAKILFPGCVTRLWTQGGVRIPRKSLYSRSPYVPPRRNRQTSRVVCPQKASNEKTSCRTRTDADENETRRDKRCQSTLI